MTELDDWDAEALDRIRTALAAHIAGPRHRADVPVDSCSRAFVARCDFVPCRVTVADPRHRAEAVA